MKLRERYSRQILFEGIGKEGQERLLSSRVLIIGCGALGSSQAEILARAGIGHLRIVDRDFVEFSNLQRQTMFSERDAEERLPKAIACKKRIAEINSEIETEAEVADVNLSNIERLIADCDVVIDGTDNFATRYLINDACVKHRVDWIYGAAVASYGVTMTILPKESPCLRCVFEELPPAGSAETCDTAGVIMPIISVVAAMQTSEALKLLTGKRDKLHRSLMQFDVWQNEWRKIKLSVPREDCETCVKENFALLDADSAEFVAVLCGRDAVQISPPGATRIDLKILAEKLRPSGEVKVNEYLLRFRRNGYELTVFQDARAIVKGVDDVSVARSLYAKFVGS